MLRTLPLLILAIALLLVAGCAEHAPASVVPSGGLSASVSKVEDHWNFGLGCYWKPSGTVYNSGDSIARNVVVSVQLIDISTGNIRDSKTIAIGDLAKGDSRSFEISLDGDCDRNYRIEVKPMGT
ncbi:MAG: FxLYD domain-containing protein [Methanomicrobiales archaeon]|nr:FxLYD domain-containing protein [Methanomicrobiales archaeon]